MAGDGCDPSCLIEYGAVCPGGVIGSISICNSICGDMIIHSVMESCDDGNFIDGDGCDSSCMIESSYDCTGEPSVCA